MNKTLTLAAATAITGLLALASPARAQTLVTAFQPYTVTPAPGVWFQSDVRPGGTASIVNLTGVGGNLENAQPLPRGAALLTTNFTNAAKAEVAVVNNYGVVNNILPNLIVGFSWHKATNPLPGANQLAAPSLKLTFYNPVCSDPASGGDCYITFVWEAYLDRHAPVPPADTWTREDFDADIGGWWTTGGFGTPPGNGGCGAVPCPTLREWSSVLSSDFGRATLVAISVGVGTNNQGQIGYFDDVIIAGTRANAIYDFEPPFASVKECVTTLIAENCSALSGKARVNCNHEQQLRCFDLYNIK